MESEKPLLSQKEYLKKYLSKDKNKKKKKKSKVSSSSHIKRSVIIDDDLGLKDIATVDDEEFNLDYLGDEAPQIAGIVDERPDELKAKEKYSNNLWSTVGEKNINDDSMRGEGNNSKLGETNCPSNYKKNSDSDSDLSLPRSRKQLDNDQKQKDFGKSKSENKKVLQKKNRDELSSDSDLSPARRSDKKVYGSDLSFERRRGKKKFDSDVSPERKRSKNSDSDISPPRRSRNKTYRKESDTYDLKNKNSYGGYKNSVNTRKPDKFDKYYFKNKRTSSLHEESSSDTSFKDLNVKSKDRYKRNEEKENKKREERKFSNNSRFDEESIHSFRHRNNEEHRRHGERASYSSKKYNVEESTKRNEHSSIKSKRLERKEDSDSDLSPTRHPSHSQGIKNKSAARKIVEDRMLDGKKSGLQDAKHLKEELKRLKENEDKLFKKMDPSLLGANAAPIKRDRKTGQVRQIQKEKEAEKAKAEKQAKTENKYYKWGKGLKQMQDQEDRISDALHEMSKPLARYRDDKDLDAFLRSQEREGDPMLDYIKSKQAESHSVIDLSMGSKKPRYNGSFMPNRYGIEPGYRWDGVDRSNGYEKKWFDQKNARKAVEEQAYKWSTSDM